jgi:hypothetical protein
MQNRGREILLLVLAVAALGVALYTFRSKSAPTAAPKPPAAAQEEGRQQVAEAPKEPPATPEAGPAGTGASGASAGVNRNPFSAPEGPPPPQGPKTGGAGASGASAKGQPQGAPAPEGPPGVLPSGPPQPVDTGLKLVGTLSGPSPLAVIRYGDKPYYVHVGDRIADSYRVKAIGADGEVVLVGQQGTTIVLRKGKSS